MTEAAFALDAIEHTYPGAVPVRALRPTSLRIEQGDSVGVVGPSGSGKTTLLQILGLVATPSGGQLSVCGQPTSGLSSAELSDIRGARIGFVFQAFHLMRGRTVFENVQLGTMYNAQIRPSERASLVGAALETVGMSHRTDHLPTQLSGGEAQRVAIARAIVCSPAIILADEPTGNLDSENSTIVLDCLMNATSNGATLVVITHDLEVAGRFARRLRIRDGVVEWTAP